MCYLVLKMVSGWKIKKYKSVFNQLSTKGRNKKRGFVHYKQMRHFLFYQQHKNTGQSEKVSTGIEFSWGKM